MRRLLAVAAIALALPLGGCYGMSALTMDVATEDMIDHAIRIPPPPDKPAPPTSNDQEDAPDPDCC